MKEKFFEIMAAYKDPACDNLTDEAQKSAAGCDLGENANAFASFQNIIYVMIGVTAVIAVVMIVIGGINYTTSAGDGAKAKKAKDTILYGVIGLIIAIMAFAIITFVTGAIKIS